MSLTTKQKKALRGEGHHLNPVVHVGQAGVHPPVIEKTLRELEAHELIKIRVGLGSSQSAKEVAPVLSEATSAEVIQVIGHTILIFKKRKKKQNKKTSPDGS